MLLRDVAYLHGILEVASLAILHAAVPPSWHLLLKQGRTVPEMGEYVVMREHDAAHQDEAITSGMRLGLVAGRCWMGDTQDAGIWVEKMEYSELYRGFVQLPRRGRRPSSVGRRRLIDRSS